MPSWDFMTPLGLEMMDDIPAWLRDDPDARAVIHAHAKSTEELIAAAAGVRDDLIPVRATSRGLGWFELYFGLTVDPAGHTLEQRRADILARLRSEPTKVAGSTWEDDVTALIGPSYTYVEDANARTITITIPYAPGSATFERFKEQVPRLASWPVHLHLIVDSTEGFLLDLSLLDEEIFGS